MYKALNMEEHKDVEVLLKNIQEGIRLYGVKELNQAITSALYKKTDKADEIEYIKTVLCDSYNISRHTLMTSKKHGDVQTARQIAYCLLYFDLGLSLREIAEIFGKFVRSVSRITDNFRTLNTAISTDRKFLEEYKNFQQKVLLYINSKN